MIIRVSEAGAVAIEDHDLFTGFHVDAPVGHTAEDIADAPDQTDRGKGKGKSKK